jgi:hypothetical protein
MFSFKKNCFTANFTDEQRLEFLRFADAYFASSRKSKEELLFRQDLIKKLFDDIGYDAGFRGINLRHYKQYEDILPDEIRKLEIKLGLIKD